MQELVREKAKTLGILLVIGLTLCAGFVYLALNGDTVSAIIAGLAGLSFLAVFMILLIDISSRTDHRNEGRVEKE